MDFKFEKVSDGLNFPEGPAWDGHGTLYASNCKSNWVALIRDGKMDVLAKASADPFTFEKTNGMTVGADGWLYACEWGAVGGIVRFSPTGKCEPFVLSNDTMNFRRPNDLIFHPNGDLYFTDPENYTRETPNGIVYRVAAGTKAVTAVAVELGFPNGLAFSADGKILYLNESAFERVLIFDVNPDGSLNNKRVFIELPGGDPDGMNLDVDGNVWIAHFGGGTIWCVRPDGGVKYKIAAPGQKPTNVEFGGTDLKTLFITEVETNAVWKMQVDVAGLKIAY